MPHVHRLPKTFHQPIKSSSSRNPRKPFRWKWFLVLVILVLAGWTFVGSNYFTVQTVQLIGTDATTAKTYSNELVGKNIFFLNQGLIEAGLIKAFPPISNVEIVRGLPKTVRLTVTLREPKVMWRSGTTQSILDSAGYVFDQGDKSNYSSLVTVVDTTGLPVKIGQPVVSQSFVDFITKVANELPKKNLTPIARFEVADTTLLVDVILTNDTKIRLSIQRDVVAQIEDVSTILTAHPEAKHIDVRVDGWGYWK